MEAQQHLVPPIRKNRFSRITRAVGTRAHPLDCCRTSGPGWSRGRVRATAVIDKPLRQPAGQHGGRRARHHGTGPACSSAAVSDGLHDRHVAHLAHRQLVYRRKYTAYASLNTPRRRRTS